MSKPFISQLKRLEDIYLSVLPAIDAEKLEIWVKLAERIDDILNGYDYHNVHVKPLRIQDDTWELYADLSHITRLSRPDLSSSDSRDNAARTVAQVVDAISAHLKSAGYNASFTHLDLHNTGASLRSIWKTDLIDEICAVDLSRSSVSAKTFTNLHRPLKLRTVILDHCGSTGERFENLGNCKNLETISLVETNLHLPRNWLVRTGANCHKLQNIYISMGVNQKILGLGDNVTLTTIINPLILGCGHLISEEILGYMMEKRCPTCRTAILADPLKISPIIWIRKNGEKWISEPVDILREPLGGKVLCHTSCGALYNERSLSIVFLEAWNGWDTVVTDTKWQICIGCGGVLNKNVQIVYITSKGGTAQEVGFLGLRELNMYIRS